MSSQGDLGAAESSTNYLLAGLSAAAAAIHFSVLKAHFDEAAIFGVFFGTVATLQLLWALLVMVSPNRLLLQLGAWGNAVVALVWIMSRVVGVPFGPHPWEAEPLTFLDGAATAFEVILAGLIFTRARVRLPGPGAIGGAGAAVAFAAIAIVVADPHTHDRPGAGLATQLIEGGAFSTTTSDGEIVTAPMYGGYMEGFLDQLEPGQNAVHIGFFTRSGKDLAIQSVELTYGSGEGPVQLLETERLAASHFVAPVRLAAGTWTFRVEVTPESGGTFLTEFSQKIAR
jgi:hypothetical protein